MNRFEIYYVCVVFLFLKLWERRLYKLWWVSLGHGVRYWGPCGGSRMFLPFSGARSKGVGFDCTRWYVTLSGGIGREEGWKE